MRPLPCVIAVGALLAAAALVVPHTAGAVPPPNFRTPSGDIGCDMRADAVRCDVLGYTYRPPPRPRGCRAKWGGALYVTRSGRARFICHRGTVVPPPGRARTAPHGTSIYRNGFRCTVTRAGVTCVNPAGRGFFVSKQRYRRF